MRRARTAALALALAAALGACGIPADEGPRAIPDEQAPEDLETATEAPGGQVTPATLYFVQTDDQGREFLAGVEREVVSSGSASPEPALVLEALLDGLPDNDPLAERTASKIPSGADLGKPPELVRGVLRIELSEMSGVVGEAAAFAYGQIVCTADALPGVDGVVFTEEGRVRAAFQGDTTTTREPLACDDYSNLLAASADTETAASPVPTPG